MPWTPHSAIWHVTCFCISHSFGPVPPAMRQPKRQSQEITLSTGNASIGNIKGPQALKQDVLLQNLESIVKLSWFLRLWSEGLLIWHLVLTSSCFPPQPQELKLHSPLTCSVITYAFQLSFSFPGIAPAFLNIVQNRKIVRNDLIIHCFWQQFQPTMFPSLFLNSLVDYRLKQIPDPVKRQQICKRFTQRKCSSASSHSFSQLDPANW